MSGFCRLAGKKIATASVQQTHFSSSFRKKPSMTDESSESDQECTVYADGNCALCNEAVAFEDAGNFLGSDAISCTNNHYFCPYHGIDKKMLKSEVSF
jgi:hypothetical protein